MSSSEDVSLTIAIPCYNEEKLISITLDTVVAALQNATFSYEIIVIDDRSTDATSRVVEEWIQAHPDKNVRLSRNPRNRGLSRSYVDGAFLGKGKYYRLVCGDNAEPKEVLEQIFKHVGEADMIIPFQSKVLNKSILRKGISKFYTFLVNSISGYRIRYYNGLAIHTRYNVMRWGPYSFGFGFQAELITRLLNEGASYVEVPVEGLVHQKKDARASALNLYNFLSVGHTLLEIAVHRIRRTCFHK